MTVRRRRFYVDFEEGQLHLRQWSSGGAGRPLLCLHAMPLSGVSFETLAPLLAEGRDVYALDYPGYGGSDSFSGAPSIEAYGKAAAAAAREIGGGAPVDLFGFHTGCLVGPELALQAPELVGKIVLADIPFFDKATREARIDAVSKNLQLTMSPDCLADAWTFNIVKMEGVVPLPRAFELFVEQLRAGETSGEGFRAAFSYPSEERFPKVTAPVLVLATQSGLLEGTRAAAGVLPNATLVERLDVTRGVLEAGAAIVAEETTAFLG